MSNSQLEVIVFDVGEGNSAAVGFEEGGEMKWGLIDCCQADWQSEPPVLTFLRDHGITAIEFICLTHFHFDHYRGLSHVLQYCEEKGYPIYSFWRCGIVSAVDVYHRMLDHAKKVLSYRGPADKERTLITEHEKRLSVARTRELHKILLWWDRMIQRKERGELQFWPKKLHGVDKGFKRYGKHLVFHCLAPTTISEHDAEAHLAFIAGDLPKALKGDSEQANHASVILFMVFGKAKLLFGGDAGVEVWHQALDEASESGQFRRGQVKADLLKASPLLLRVQTLWLYLGRDGLRPI